jgi:shikimate kinase
VTQDELSNSENKTEAPAPTTPEPSAPKPKEKDPTNIVLMGIPGCGKSSVGWFLARIVGFGFIDLDQVIEQKERKSITDLAANRGQDQLKQLERKALESLVGIKNHVITANLDTMLVDENWEIFKKLGSLVWLNTPVEKTADRLIKDKEKLKHNNLLIELTSENDPKALKEKLVRILENWKNLGERRFAEATLVVEDYYARPEASAQFLQQLLLREKIIQFPEGRRPFWRWKGKNTVSG